MMDAGTDITVGVDGLAFRCRVDGREGAEWLVFSNSLLTDLSLWDEQVAALAGRFRILRYDQRGHGGTEVPDGPATIDALVADAASLLDAFRIARASFVGISLGAATAFAIAARLPGRITRIVACDGQASSPPGSIAAWQERIDLAAAEGMAGLVEPTVRRWFPPEFVAAGGPGLAHVRAMIRGTKFGGFVACARALQDYDLRPALPGLVPPALLVVGGADGSLPEAMRGIAARIPHAAFVEFPGAGHLVNIQAPDAFNRTLSSFLSEAGG